LLLGYSRQSYYQGISYIQQKAYEADIIIEEVLRYRKQIKRIGTRKMFGEMKTFLANRGFIPTTPNQLWVSDITYIHLSEGFAYLSLITDAYSRKIVGFCLCRDLSTRGPLHALKMAIESNPHREELIHHSDRGVQYCCDQYVDLLDRHAIKISMTENGDPLENALAERVNGILKHELLEEKFVDFETAQREVAIACSTYNHLRPHGSIDNLKPAQAHQLSGTIKKRWTNYWQKNKGKEVLMV